MKNNKVTVICFTYNHELYIEQCLRNIAGQKTNFAFKVLVHDDASTDSTQSIIQSVIEEFPGVFVPILQKENQYSKGVPIKKTFLDSLIEGDYIATCEGDDYWDDPYKLQRQVDFLERNKDYSACVHNTRRINMLSHKETLFNNFSEDCDISIESVISKGSAVFHTSSVVYRKEFGDIPDCFTIKGIGDYPKAIYLALNGKIRCLKQVMSVYRMGTKGSWTSMQTIESTINNCNSIITMLNNANSYSDFKYNRSFSLAVRYHEYIIDRTKGKFRNVISKYRDFYRRESLLYKFKFPIKCLYYFVMGFYK